MAKPVKKKVSVALSAPARSALPKPEIITAKKKRRLAAPRQSSRELLYRAAINGWTPGRVMEVRDQADNGNMMYLADLCETMFRDARIKGVLATRTHGLLGLPINFDGGDDHARGTLAGNTDGKNGEWYHMHDESELAKLARWGLFMGIGIAQRIPLPRIVGSPQRYRIETWSPRWLTYFHYMNNGAHWNILTQDGLEPVIPGDGKWIVFQPYGARRPWVEGHWNPCAFPWLLKHFSMEDRANLSESLGSPVWVGNTGHGGTEKQRAKYLSQMRAMGKNGKFVLPKDWDLKLVEAQSAGKQGDVFDQQIRFSNEEITIELAGQLVTTEGTSGFSSGNIFEVMKQDLIRFDGERLDTCLYEQSTRPWALENYGRSSAAPWGHYQTERPDDLTEKSTAMEACGKAIKALDEALAPHGLQTNAQAIVEKYGIPVLTKAKADTPLLQSGDA